jgi:hypothetical protein
VRQVQSVELTCCARCGDRAEPLLAPRSALRPFGSWLPGALAWPLGRAQLVGVAGLAAVLWPLWNFGALAGLLGFLVYWAFLFGVVRRTAAGDDDLGPPDFTDVFADLVMPSVRGAVACAPIWALALVFVVGAVEALKSGTPIGVVPWLCLAAAVVLGLVYGPAAVLLAALGVGALDLLNPLAAVRLAHRLGRDDALAAGDPVLPGAVPRGAEPALPSVAAE